MGCVVAVNKSKKCPFKTKSTNCKVSNSVIVCGCSDFKKCIKYQHSIHDLKSIKHIIEQEDDGEL